jgi:hypothetical protein
LANLYVPVGFPLANFLLVVEKRLVVRADGAERKNPLARIVLPTTGEDYFFAGRDADVRAAESGDYTIFEYWRRAV